MRLNPEERQVLDRLSRDLRERLGVAEVRLYGSAARGDLGEESDIDLFVRVDDLTWPLEQSICDRCYEATLECGRLISPSVFSTAEWSRSPLRFSPFVRSVEREGIPL